MSIIAKKEIYRLDIKIGVDGDKESKKKLSDTEKVAEKVKNKVSALDKITASPTAKLKDNASSSIDKIKSKTEKLNNTSATAKIKAKDEASTVIDKAKNKVDSWIKTGAKKVISLAVAGTLAVGGLGVGSAIKTFASFEQGLSNVKAVTDATDVQMKQLSNTAKNLGASTAWSAAQVADAEQLLGQAGYSVSETITALPGLLSLASAGSLDLSAATSIASSTLRGFNLDVGQTTHVADALALTANATNSDVTDLGESLKYISPVANALGISMEDAVAATGLLSNQAIVGSQAGTVLRQTMARLASPTKEAAKIMGQYGINAFDAQGNMKPLSSVIDNLNGSLSKLTSQKRADVISTIFGTESMSGVMALMNQGGQSLSNLSSKLEGAQGAADKMANTKLDNLLGQWEQLKGAAETMKINLGEKLAPYAKEFVTWLSSKMPEIENKVVSIVDYLSKNIGTIKTIAASVAGIGVAFAGLSVLSTVGNGIAGLKTIGGLLGGIGVASKASATVGGIAEVASGIKTAGLAAKIIPALFSPAGLAIAAIGVMGVAAAHELSQDVVPSVDLFADKIQVSTNKVKNSLGNTVDTIDTTTIKISDATKKSVGAYMEMDNKVQKTLLNMKYTNAVLTNDISNDLKTTFSSMGETITTELDKDLTDSSDKIQKMFSNSSLASADQTDILTKIQNHYDKQKTTTKTAMDEINGILSDASNNNRQLTSDEYARIDEARSQMTKNAVNSLSENEKESAVILGRIKDQSTRITAETASEIVMQLEAQRLKTIDSANVEYAERVRIAEAIRSEGGAKATETADAIITEAQRQRDETIQAANDTKTQGIDVLKQSYSDLGTTVDSNSGQILNWWGRLKAWWDNNTFASKTADISVSTTDTSAWGGNSDYYQNEDKTTAGYQTTVNSWNGYASGTNNATQGIHSVAEQGFEIVFGKQNRLFNGGEKVLNHEKSTTFLENQQNNEPFQVKQGQYQLAQPKQVQVAGVGGNSVQVDVQVNSGQEVEGLIVEVTQAVGRKLKEALTNIKK